jgi:UDP-N-acetyl-2-amino-2-deoxyglucuronate dehydrogenase
MSETRKVGIIGCGKILERHAEAVRLNKGFELVALCDVQKEILRSMCGKHRTRGYEDYRKMLSVEELDMVVIATPNSLHVEQAEYCLAHSVDILVEKPVSLNPSDVARLSGLATANERMAYCVLQVRLNPSVQTVARVLELGLLGEIRGMSMVQRWQRPYEYFSGWRAQPDIGGGTLYECGIHYLDVMNELLGTPKIISSKVYATKHKTSQIEDTIYSLLDFGNYGGTVEVTVSAEPHNLECSLSIMGSNGYIKLGGKAMNIIESANFLSNGCRVEYENLLKSQNIPNAPNSYGSYAGSCPNHSELYENLENFPIISALKSIEIIDEIYNAAGVRYY